MAKREQYEQYPDQSNETGQGIPHSGVHHGEKPHREFNNTPLDRAVQEGLIKTPSSPATLHEQKSWKRPVAGVLGLGLAAGAAVFGYNQLNGEDNSVNNRESTSAPVGSVEPGNGTQKETESQDNGPTAIDYETYKDDAEGLAEAFTELRNQWLNSGYSVDLAKSDERFSMSEEEYATGIAQKTDAEYIEAMMAPGWDTNPVLVDFVNTNIKNHDGLIQMKLITSDPKNGDDEVYESGINLDQGTASIVTSDDETVVLQFSWSGSDNRDQNRGEDFYINDYDPNTETGGGTYTFKNIDGSLKLADYVR
jgi:hypothetical protein